MSSSASNGPDLNALFQDIYQTVQSEPDPIEEISSLRPSKRRRPNEDGTSDDESHDRTGDSVNGDKDGVDESAFSSTVVTQNILAKVKRYADSKKLKSEQKAEVERFVQEPILVQLGKIFVNQLAAHNEKVNAIATGPSFKIEKVLQENVSKYSAAALLSPKLRTYKGDAPKDVLLGIIKQKRFGLYDGIERNASHWKMVTNCVNTALTQTRSNLKKLLRSSISHEVKVNSDQMDKNGRPKKITQWCPLEKDNQRNIYALTQEMAQLAGSSTASVALCARVSLMRLVFRSHPGEDFWDRLDAWLIDIYETTKEEPLALRRVFESVLKSDRENHGVNEEFEIPEGESEFQAGVNELLEAQAANVASTAIVSNN